MEISMYEACKNCKHFVNDYNEISETGVDYEFDVLIGGIDDAGYCKAYKGIVVSWKGNLVMAPECPYFEPREEV